MPNKISLVMLVGLIVVIAFGTVIIFAKRTLPNTPSFAVESPTTDNHCDPPVQARTVLPDEAESSTYTDPTSKVAFHYSKNFSTPLVTNVAGGVLSGPYKSIVFNSAGGPPVVCVQSMSFQVYTQLDGKHNTHLQQNLDILQGVYKNAQVGCLQGNAIPTGGAYYANTDCSYLEVAGTPPLRGYYQFTQPVVGDQLRQQDLTLRSTGQLKMDSLLVVLTDGVGTIVQMTVFNQPRSEAPAYQPLTPRGACEGTSVTSCPVNTELLSLFRTVYQPMLQSLMVHP